MFQMLLDIGEDVRALFHLSLIKYSQWGPCSALGFFSLPLMAQAISCSENWCHFSWTRRYSNFFLSAALHGRSGGS